MSDPNRSPFPLGRLVLGVFLIVVLAGALVVGAARFIGEGGAGRLAYIGTEGLVLRDLDSGDEEVAAPWEQGWTAPTIDRDGDRFAYGSGGDVFVRALGSEETEQVGEGEPVGWDPEGRLVFARPVREGRTILVRLTDDGPTEIVPLGLGSHEGDVLWAARDRFAVRLLDREGGSGALVIVDLTGGTPSLAHRVPDGVPLAISPDGTQLLYTTTSEEPTELRILDLAGFETREVGLELEADAGAASPSGLVAVSGSIGTDVGIWVLRGGGEGAERIVDGFGSGTLAWAPDDGAVFAVRSDELVRVTVPDGEVEGLGIVPDVPTFFAVVP